MSARATDKGKLAAWWGRFGRDVVTVFAVALAGWAVWSATHAVDKAKTAAADAKRAATNAQRNVANLRAESKQRIDETCRISETRQRSDVRSLERTYGYLSQLTPKQFGEPLNRAILAGLPSTVRDAETDDAPAYCDAKGVGLPEPDLKIPKRPSNLPPSSS